MTSLSHLTSDHCSLGVLGLALRDCLTSYIWWDKHGDWYGTVDNKDEANYARIRSPPLLVHFRSKKGTGVKLRSIKKESAHELTIPAFTAACSLMLSEITST